MHGLGDNLHQRAFIRQYLEDYNVYLETSWPQVYWDFPELKFISKGTRLRTQLKNQERTKQFYSDIPNQFIYKSIKAHYPPDSVRQAGCVLDAIVGMAGGNILDADFSFSPKQEWIEKAKDILEENKENKPVLIFRPLCERKEWGGCKNRNPDINSYINLFKKIKDDFFVISIADLQSNFEWIVSEDISCDLKFHKGELSFEEIAGLFKLSSLVFCAPGFSTVLSRSMGIPVITIFGGYEDSSSFKRGYGPYLGVDTIKPCQCFSHIHRCEKRIDMIDAEQKIKEFIDANVRKN